MATLTIRINDEDRDQLREVAESSGLTLSEFARQQLVNVVHQFRDDPAGQDQAPDSLSIRDRHMFALLHRILGRVLPEDANGVDGDLEYQLERARVLEQGLTAEYWTEFAGLDPELSQWQCKFVMDVLDMFRIAGASLDKLEQSSGELESSLRTRLTFDGFDMNDPTERAMLNYVRFLVEDDRWDENAELLHGPTRGNSHGPRIHRYSRMLNEYRRIRRSKPMAISSEDLHLSQDELVQIAEAVVA